MDLLVFRHGIAEDAADAGKSDFDRELTRRGVERTTRAAAGLARVADAPQAILTSPKLRAAQTARIAAEAFDMDTETCDVLAEQDVAAIHDMLRRRREDRLMVVGHEPVLSQLVERLCLAGASSRSGFVEMKKAGGALVTGAIRRDEPPQPVALHWLLPPRVLRALGGA